MGHPELVPVDEKCNRRSFDSLPHPCDEDLSLGTPALLAQDDGSNFGDEDGCGIRNKKELLVPAVVPVVAGKVEI
jgi:hypothetical protein